MSLSLFTVGVRGAAQSLVLYCVEVGNCAPNVSFVSLVREKKQQREVIRVASLVLHLIPMQPMLLKC